MKVGIIDYGSGNLASVARALEVVGASPFLVNHPTDLPSCDALILPGVGSFAECSALLNKDGWTTALRDEVLGKDRFLLGLCVGMQILADSSTEGAAPDDTVPGLGLIPGQVKHLTDLGCTNRVPHVGWNGIFRGQNEDPLIKNIPDGTDFYFVHSYAFVAECADDISATTDYGIPLTAAVHRGHIWGTQFHPEKSSRAGFQLLRDFIEAVKC